jgi:hypothetical protein
VTAETSGRASQLLRSSWLHGLALSGATLAAWLSLGIGEAGLRWDPAYFTYLGQAVLRGDPLYSHTFHVYPPLGALILAGVMAIGGWLDVPTYLSPRVAAVACGVAGAVLVYLVVRRATANPWAGLVAGIALAGFHRLATSSLSTLEPKHLVILFTLAAAAACQRGRWRLTGCAAAFAATTYQPALLTPIALAALAWHSGRSRRDRSLGAYVVGFGIGLLPSALYLTATGGWADFWVRAVVLISAAHLPSVGESPAHVLNIVRNHYASDLPFFLVAVTGWIVFAVTSVRGGHRDLVRAWLGSQTAGMPLLAVLWSVAAAFEFQGPPDVYLLLPFVAFWAGWLVQPVTELAARVSRGRPPLSSALRAGVGAAALLLAIFVAFRDVPGVPRAHTLSRQLAEVERITAQSGDSVMAFSAEEIYVLSERRSPLPFLRLPDIFVRFLPEAGFLDCLAVAQRVVAERPRAVVFRARRNDGCEPRIAAALVANDYELEERALRLRVFWRDGAPPHDTAD